MKKTKRLGNQGFSLVELIVVVAIIALIVGVFSIGYSVVGNKSVEQCAKRIETVLENCRNTTMGKLTCSVSFYISDGKLMVDKEVNGEHTYSELSGKDVTVQYLYWDHGVHGPADMPATPITITFNRASGSLEKQPVGGPTGREYVTGFRVSNGNNTLEISVDKLTGRVTVE